MPVLGQRGELGEARAVAALAAPAEVPAVVVVAKRICDGVGQEGHGSDSGEIGERQEGDDEVKKVPHTRVLSTSHPGNAIASTPPNRIDVPFGARGNTSGSVARR